MADTLLGTADADTPIETTNAETPNTQGAPTTPPTGDNTNAQTSNDQDSTAPAPDTESPTTGETDAATGNELALPDWAKLREQLADGDDKVLKRLSRYATLKDAIKAGVEAQNKIGSIKAIQPITKESTPEEIAAYREAHGIPESPDKYEIKLPDGMVLGEEDKPMVDEFLKLAHENNIPAPVANALIAQQLAAREQLIEQQEAKDSQDLIDARKTLTSNDVWGSEAKLNINLINNMLDGAQPGLKEQLMGARLANGKLLGNDPDALLWLASVARDLNPLATVTPSSGMSTLQTVEEEIASLEKLMGDSNSDYWKGPNAQAKQDRYRALVEAKLKMQSKQ